MDTITFFFFAIMLTIITTFMFITTFVYWDEYLNGKTIKLNQPLTPELVITIKGGVADTTYVYLIK